MKKLFALAVASFIIFSTEAQQLTTPQTSPTTEVKQNFALSSIELSYSRPGVKAVKFLEILFHTEKFGEQVLTAQRPLLSVKM